MILMLDNYDSFTYNLVRYFEELGETVIVKRNDAISIDDIDALQPDHLVISPGPCTPNESGVCLAAIERFAGQIPLLGVCLGHQAIAQVFGASVVRANRPVHGKISAIHHCQRGLFQDLPQGFNVTRYHSLVVDESSLTDEFEITAWNEVQGEREHVMAIAHKTLPIAGVQFHPESVMTEHGHQLLQHFITQA